MNDYFTGINFDELLNDHKKIIEEINQLRQENEELKKEIKQLKQENEQCKEALRRCNEQELEISYECDSCGQGIIEREFCRFCGGEDYTHADDCEYVRLTGGEE